MEQQGPGLLVCDEELVARVWDRVAAGSPALACQPEGGERLTSPAPLAVAETAEVDPTCAALQRWTLRLLLDAAECRALARRMGRRGETLTALAREKGRQAKTLAAEYFLRTGVRYWPREVALPLPALADLPALRALCLAQKDREAALRAQAAREEPELAGVYLELADAARAAARRLRALLEKVW